jgi:hypothetical protein
LNLANQKELDEISYNDYQLATEQMRRKLEKIRSMKGAEYFDIVIPATNYGSMNT